MHLFFVRQTPPNPTIIQNLVAFHQKSDKIKRKLQIMKTDSIAGDDEVLKMIHISIPKAISM